MKFKDLFPGDRFTAFGSLWTKLGRDTARIHKPEVSALGERAAGHREGLCDFGPDDEVKFLPISVDGKAEGG